jgi:hypothetical protein
MVEWGEPRELEGFGPLVIQIKKTLTKFLCQRTQLRHS